MKSLQISKEDHLVLKLWCKKLDVSMEGLIKMWVEKVKQRKHIAWYDSLPDPKEVRRKALENTKIGMIYKTRRCS